MMPPDGPVRRRNLENLAELQFLQLREIVRHHQTAALGRQPIHLVGGAFHRIAMRRLRDARDLDRHDHDRRPPEHDARVPHHLHALDPRDRRQLPRHRRRKPDGAHHEVLRRQDEEVGVERRLHPVDDRGVARVRHAGERDHQRQRQHQCRHARRGTPRRLNQTVGRQRPLDRAKEFQERPQRPGEPQRQQRAQQQRDDDGEYVAGVESGPRSADQETRDGDSTQRGRQQRADPVLAGRQHLILPLLQRLNRIDPGRVPRRDECGDDARRDPDRQGRGEHPGTRRELVGMLRDAIHVADQAADRRHDPARDQHAEHEAAERSDEAGDRTLAKKQPTNL